MDMSKKNNLSESVKTPKDKDERGNPGVLPGQPGYRTRDGRSGYDPIDSRTEAAYMSGTFIKKLFTGQLRTRNPIILSLLGILGLVLIIPLILAISETIRGNPFSWDAWIFVSITGIVGLAALINFIKSLIR
jgi:hypothetical protein